MVPNIGCSKGASFRGAGAYHLHNKGDALNKHPTTSERVAWTATRNLVNDAPGLAIDEMWHTAEAAAQLKRISGRGKQGRKGEGPVKTLSLSWAPHQSPNREEMEAAADSFLKHMGWQEHQALLIAHTDTAHPHLHVILNRVHPETGLVLNDWREQRRSQRWGDAYDREQGLILCPVRFEKYDKGRFDLQPDGMPYPYAKLIQEQERALDNPLAEAAVQDRTEKDLLAERHREEREAFLASGKAQFREARQAAYREVRDEFKPHWREHFAHDRDLHNRLEHKAAIAYPQVVRLAREGDHEAAAELLATFHDERATALADLATSRKDLRQLQLDTTRERQDQACRHVIALRGVAFDEIKDRQKEERAEFKELLAQREAGQPYDIDRLQELLGQEVPGISPNGNRAPAELIELTREGGQAHGASEPALNPFTQHAHELFAASGYREPSEKSSSRHVTDIAAAGIGAAIEIGVRLMEGVFAAPSPREQAIAKAWAIREHHEAPKRAEALQDEKQRDDFTRHALTAVREAQAEHDRERELEHEERGRSRERER